MKTLDGFTEAYFKTLDDGTLLFYPWGILGKGRILPGAEKKNQIEKELKRHNLVMLPVGLLSGIISGISLVFSWWYCFVPSFLVLAAVSIWSIKTNAELIKGLPVTPLKISAGEIYGKAAQSCNIVLLWCLEVISLLFVLGGVFVLVIVRNILVGLAGIGFFGLCSLIYGYMIYTKKQSCS